VLPVFASLYGPFSKFPSQKPNDQKHFQQRSFFGYYPESGHTTPKHSVFFLIVSLVRPERKMEDDIKIELKEIGLERVK
jgi:hypothetical protein